MAELSLKKMINEPDNKTKELLSKSELSIWLDTYDDIFSDFDSRTYEERALSDDFVYEARKMAKEKPSGKIELKLLIPKMLRDPTAEEIIIKSIHKYFQHSASLIHKEMTDTLRRGYLFGSLGLIIMIVTAFLINADKVFYLNAIRVIMEPAGWFLAWTGLDHIFYISRKKKPELQFGMKMAHAEITFLSI